MGRLAGKVALITGGARGQGAAEARLFAGEGATVAITDVLDDAGEATAADLGEAVTYFHQDVTSEDEWAAVVDRILNEHGWIDVLVNNAGIVHVGGVLDTDLDDWNRVIAINQTGVFLGMKTVGPTMRDRRAGSIINISSIAGLSGTPMFHAYGASKWAVRGMTKSAARELAAHQVRVNSVHPGLIETPMMHELGANAERLATHVPMGRVASADEVARLVLFLASDESVYCTGHEYVIDGGMRA
jgi:3alpha(or 20beta)-hydroxysteroid dehydrogenase